MGMMRTLIALGLCASAAACGGGTQGGTDLSAAAVVQVDGSSTVYPITEAVAEEFRRATRARVTVGISGTGGGFQKFCRDEIDIADASRPIAASEVEACAKTNVDYIELPVAYDGLAVVVHPKNTFAASMTVAELKKLWEPGAQGQIKRWNQVRDGWPDSEVHLFGAGVDSGTFDYFTEVIMGKAKASRGDYTSSEDDNVIVQGVSGDEFALGYFGYAYYEENKDKLKLVAIDDGDETQRRRPDSAVARNRRQRHVSSAVASGVHLSEGEVARPARGEELRGLLSERGDSARSRRRLHSPAREGVRDGAVALCGEEDRHHVSRHHVRAGDARAKAVAIAMALRSRALIESVIEWTLFFCAAGSILITAGIVAVLVFETIEFLREVPITEFLFGTVWTPLFSEKHFGVLPLVSGTVLTSMIAMAVALPAGLLTAIYLSEYAAAGLRRIVRPVLEVLAGIPTVVYGYFALQFVTPLLQGFVPALAGFNALGPGIVMGIMILPLVSSLSEDALHSVPNGLREGAYALGSTRMQTSLRVVVPAAFSGISAAAILAVSRAIGETMIVAIAAGQQPRLTLDPRVPVETMTAYIVQVSLGDTPAGTLEYRTIFAVGMLLFVSTFALNLISTWLRNRFREEYA